MLEIDYKCVVHMRILWQTYSSVLQYRDEHLWLLLSLQHLLFLVIPLPSGTLLSPLPTLLKIRAGLCTTTITITVLLVIDSITLSNHGICQHSINICLVSYTKYYTSIMEIIIETYIGKTKGVVRHLKPFNRYCC